MEIYNQIFLNILLSIKRIILATSKIQGFCPSRTDFVRNFFFLQSMQDRKNYKMQFKKDSQNYEYEQGGQKNIEFLLTGVFLD